MDKRIKLAHNILELPRLIFIFLAKPGAFFTLLRVRRSRLSYLGIVALADLIEAVISIERQKLPGVFMEAGCALGGSALVITSAKSKDKPFFVYDVFGLIPSPGQEDGQDSIHRYEQIVAGESSGIAGNEYYGYVPDLYEVVQKNFYQFKLPPSEHNVELVKGLFEDTLVLRQPVAFAHLDCDWYASVKTCLERIVPCLVPGGRLVIDDYDDWSGCKKAVDEYFYDKMTEYEFKYRKKLHIRKK